MLQCQRKLRTTHHPGKKQEKLNLISKMCPEILAFLTEGSITMVTISCF